jgi:beta-lactamase regulating signal transducer with metallopeptidase domain
MISSIWVHNLVAYSLQVALVVGSGALLHRLFRPRISPATLAYCQALLLACLLLPLCQPWKASRSVSLTVQATVLSTAERAAATSTNLSPTAQSSAWPVQETLLAAVVAGSAGRACWLVLGSISLFRLRRRSLRLSSASHLFGEVQRTLGIRAVFYTSDRIASPITFGLLRPVIILPHSVLAMETPIQEAIACHELFHVRRRDWIFEVIEECIRALLWFHPAIWWLIGRIQVSREQVVDRAVIHLTQSREQYVDALLTVALAKSQPQLIPAPLFLRRRLLKQRVAEILKESSMSKLRLTFCLAAISGLVLMAGAASVRMFPLEVRAQESGSEPVQVVRGASTSFTEIVSSTRNARSNGVLRGTSCSNWVSTNRDTFMMRAF